MSDRAQPMKRSSRDPESVCARLEGWLATKLGPGADPSVRFARGTSSTGMSSETLLFDASWTQDGTQRHERLVARIAPDVADVPVFPSYDLPRQARVIELVAEVTDVPVPRIWWSEDDPSVIGAPFFVMQRVDGLVPPDVLPYTFGDNWLYDAAVEDRQRLEESTIDVIARLHTIPDAPRRFDLLASSGPTPLRAHVARTKDWYAFAANDGMRSSLVERAFRWLEEHWPPSEGDAVLSWGDARIGNVIYHDFEPAAVLDWEMAGLGPRELDVAWLVYAHQVFEHLAARFGAPGMPDFLVPENVLATYEAMTGRTIADFEFYLAYSALQWGIVFLRTGARAIRFGERSMPDDPDELMHHRELFEQALT